MSRSNKAVRPTTTSPAARTPKSRAHHAAGARLLLHADAEADSCAGWTICRWSEASTALQRSWDVVALWPGDKPLFDSTQGLDSAVPAMLRSFVEAGGTVVAVLPPTSTETFQRNLILDVLGGLIDCRMFDLSGGAGQVDVLRGYRWTARRPARRGKRSGQPDRIQVVPVGRRAKHAPPVVGHTGMRRTIELVLGSHYWTRGLGRVVLLPEWNRYSPQLLEIAATVPALDLGGRIVGVADSPLSVVASKGSAAVASGRKGASAPSWEFPDPKEMSGRHLVRVPGLQEIELARPGWLQLEFLYQNRHRRVPVRDIELMLHERDNEPLPERGDKIDKRSQHRQRFRQVRLQFAKQGFDREVLENVIDGTRRGYQLFVHKLELPSCAGRPRTEKATSRSRPAKRDDA